MQINRMVTSVGLVLGLVACGGERGAVDADAVGAPGAVAPEAAPSATAPNPTVVEVKMVTEGQRNYFDPAEVTVRPGDVVRFTLLSGLHNVSFPADRNAGAAGLPQASPLLQQPGQSHDVVVNFGPGSYSFQCDPHAVLGMTGTLIVRP